MQVTVEIEDQVVHSVGIEKVKAYLREYAAKLELKVAAQEALSELDQFDVTNDPAWQAARNAAWEDVKDRVLSKIRK
ncbi:hypothetical protein [Arsenicibacter rosenii]|uniref:Uncharacterized protein n=1 Tax=Arsenicibacter rosenii TaxID=1750698 RepID=A0A1S2VKC3_9BACT|nr:hypothetical protein [Arsenicibacter rosenii]OIN58675.1 hypothetical protein BLX24_14020 [Arsenicibacter rosenii]